MAEGAAFELFWKRRFGEILPLGHELREHLAHRWFRIHSLPGGKRYAETPDEYEIMLMRHAAVADAVLGKHAPCWLSMFVSDFPDDPELIEPNRADAENLGISESYAGYDHGAYRPGEDGPVPFRIFAGQTTWNADHFAGWLRAIADDDIESLLWTNAKTGTVYAPYDGGADLFLATPEERVTFQKRFQFWRSDRDDGL
jgi:hypothetical protein